MRDIPNLGLFEPGVTPEMRKPVRDIGKATRSLIATFWQTFGLILLVAGILGVVWDIFKPAWADWVLRIILYFNGLSDGQVPPGVTSYLILVFGLFCLGWSFSFRSRQDWAWLVGLWLNGFAALSFLAAGIYLSQHSWPGLVVGSLVVSRLWFAGLLVLLAGLFGWFTYVLLARVSQAYYINHVQDEASLRAATMFRVCSQCGRRLIMGCCPFHQPNVGLFDETINMFYHFDSLNGNEVVIGRRSGDILLDPNLSPTYKTVSDPHAKFILDDDLNWFIQAIKENSVTLANGRIVSNHQPLPIRVGSEIVLGSCHFNFVQVPN